MKNVVTLYDSFGMDPTEKLCRQIFSIYHNGNSKVEVHVPSIQKQEIGSNNCGMFAASIMADICFSREIITANYVSSLEQRVSKQIVFYQES